MCNFLKSSLLLLSLALSLQSEARYATYEEAPIEITASNLEVEVQKTGKYSALVEREIIILNEAGRDHYGSQTLYFTKGISDIEILEAKTILNEVEYLVPKEHIEIKPLASSEKGFDQRYQILISYPQVQIGSKLFLKYRENILVPTVENHFSDVISYGLEGYTKDSKVKIISQLPFEYLVNDPEQNIQVLFVQDKKRKILTLTQKKPVYYQLTNEPYSNVLDQRKLTSVYISTMKNFDEMGRYFAPKYESVIHQELPDIFENIYKKAIELKSENEQIDFITSSIAEKIRYMGNWLTINGKYFPRDLKVIAETGFGDCKDFSTSTAAILYRLGYKVNSSLVHRGRGYIEHDQVLPSTYIFNHAILTATSKSGKSYWIDPTNFVSMSAGIFHDISGRKALILDSKLSKYEAIPIIDPKHSAINYSKTISFNNDIINASADIAMIGERALQLTGAELTTSKTAIEESIITYFSGETKPLHKKVDLPNLKSRIVTDINIHFAFEKDDDLLRSNLGKAIVLGNLENDWVSNILKFSNENVGAAFIGEPNSYNYKTIIKNYKARTPEQLNFEIKNKWFTSKRNCYQNGDDIVVEENTILLNPIIFPEEYSTDEFKEMQKNMKKNMQGAILIGDAK